MRASYVRVLVLWVVVLVSLYLLQEVNSQLPTPNSQDRSMVGRLWVLGIGRWELL